MRRITTILALLATIAMCTIIVYGYPAESITGDIEEVEEIYSWENVNEITGSTVSENEISDVEYTGVRVVHHGYSTDSIVQNITTYTYKLWWYDFLAVIECENGSYDLNAKWDNWHSHWLCQVNDRWHKDIPAEYYTNWVVAVEYCYYKWSTGTKFNGPNRWIKGQRCKDYVKDRFTFIE